MKQVIISDLEQNICGIYKIDFPNNKCYIGQSINIKRRMWEHNTPSSNKQACDLAIKKYFGRVEKIVILEECLPEELDEKEKYWIKYFRANEKDFGYNLTEGGQEKRKTRRSFSDEEILWIRKRKKNGERKCEVYRDFSDRKFSVFEKVWLGTTYPEIGQELFAEKKTRQEYSSIANRGENNAKAKLTEQDVRNIRNLYSQGKTKTQISQQYSFVSYITISRVCDNITWKHVK